MKKNILVLPVLAAVFSLTSCRQDSQNNIDRVELLKQKIVEEGLSPENIVVEGGLPIGYPYIYVLDEKTNRYHAFDVK